MVKYYTPQISRSASGKYQYVQRYTDSSFKGIRRATITIIKDTPQTRLKADQIVKKKIQQKLQKTGLIQSDILTKNVKDTFLTNYKKRGITYNTYLSRKNQLAKFSKLFGNQPINTITTVQLNNYFNDLLYKNNFHNKTVRSYKASLSAFFTYAKTFGYIKTNPMKNIEIFYKDETLKRYERIQNFYLTDEEMALILNDCKKQERRYIYHDLFLWMYLTGMRIGEAAALKCKDIQYNEENGIWYADINGTLLANGEKQPFTKTISSMRKVSLPPQAVEIYKKRKTTKNKFLFLNDNGNPIHTNSVNKFLNRVRERTHIKKDISSHIFRHTHVSKLAEEGYSLEMISARVGHTNSDITRRIYTHITKKSKNSFDKKMNNFKFN
ncbi:tyrosine-type recombinase/integrase [Lactobacillus sp. PSON]|uniref:tyrosine-type recombinase/integrase n=1 Tax=Lactobacillus sp. PSON TaxID=3455454 RepID=UPI004043749F